MKWALSYPLRRVQIDTTLLESHLVVRIKIKNAYNVCDPEMPLLRIYPTEIPHKSTEVYIEGQLFVV